MFCTQGAVIECCSFFEMFEEVQYKLEHSLLLIHQISPHVIHVVIKYYINKQNVFIHVTHIV